MTVSAVPPPPKYARRAGFYRLSVAQFHQMIQSGVLGEKDRIELLEGYLVPIMPPNPPHSNAVSRTNRTLIRILPDTWHLRSEQPLTLSDSQPQPDFSVVRGDFSAYATRHPGSADIGLVIEVAVSSLDEDRDEMGRIYSRSSIPLYWIFNLIDHQIEVYTGPRPNDAVPTYSTRTDYKAGDSVPLVLDGQTVARIPVNDLLG